MSAPRLTLTRDERTMVEATMRVMEIGEADAIRYCQAIGCVRKGASQ